MTSTEHTTVNQQPHRSRRRIPVGASLGLLVALTGAACGNGDEPAAAPPASEASDVTMRLIAFRPERLEAKVGTSVMWTQQDAGFHTVTSGTVAQGGADVTTTPDGRFGSEQLATGDTFRFTFDTPGTYPYFCEIHPATMRGEIRIA